MVIAGVSIDQPVSFGAETVYRCLFTKEYNTAFITRRHFASHRNDNLQDYIIPKNVQRSYSFPIFRMSFDTVCK